MRSYEAVRIRKILIKASIVLLALVTAGLLLRAGLNFAMGQKLRHFLEQAKADSLPLTHQELAPVCDDADNGAPLWRAAEALFEPGQADRAVINKTIETIFNGEPVDQATRATRDRLVENNRRVFEFIAEASQRRCFRYGDWTKPIYLVGQPNAIKLIQAVRLMGIDAVLKAESGQVQEGLDECRLGMMFVRKLIDEPSLLQTLVALADMKSLLICFDRIASGRELDSATLSGWINELDPRAWRTRFARCVPSERIFNLERGLALIRGDRDALEAMGDQNQQLFLWLVRPVLKAEIIWVQKKFLDAEKRAVLPYFKVNELDQEQGEGIDSVPWYFKALGLLEHNFKSGFMKEATLEALMLTTKAGLACKIYKNQTGRYPDRLESLVPDILDDVPIDPFTGKPLIYKVGENGLLIYSLGSNEKDDGGRSTYNITQLVMPEDDDWTWRETRR
jgi:hypothetical protein